MGWGGSESSSPDQKGDILSPKCTFVGGGGHQSRTYLYFYTSPNKFTRVNRQEVKVKDVHKKPINRVIHWIFKKGWKGVLLPLLPEYFCLNHSITLLFNILDKFVKSRYFPPRCIIM